jgi:hypothetical protein
MTKICKDCKHFKEIVYRSPPPDLHDYYICKHPDYYRKNIINGEITYYNCNAMRQWGPCEYNAKLYEGK